MKIKCMAIFTEFKKDPLYYTVSLTPITIPLTIYIIQLIYLPFHTAKMVEDLASYSKWKYILVLLILIGYLTYIKYFRKYVYSPEEGPVISAKMALIVLFHLVGNKHRDEYYNRFLNYIEKWRKGTYVMNLFIFYIGAIHPMVNLLLIFLFVIGQISTSYMLIIIPINFCLWVIRIWYISFDTFVETYIGILKSLMLYDEAEIKRIAINESSKLIVVKLTKEAHEGGVTMNQVSDLVEKLLMLYKFKGSQYSNSFFEQLFYARVFMWIFLCFVLFT